MKHSDKNIDWDVLDHSILPIINTLVDLDSRVTIQGYTSNAADGVISISIFEWDNEIFGFAPLDYLWKT